MEPSVEVGSAAGVGLALADFAMDATPEGFAAVGLDACPDGAPGVGGIPKPAGDLGASPAEEDLGVAVPWGRVPAGAAAAP